MEARKRRKWDVAAPGGMPLTGNRAGIGASGGSSSGLSGFITAQGYQASLQAAPAAHVVAPAPAPAPVPAPQPSIDIKPGQPIDKATIARAQQGAQAIVERINAELRAKGQLPPMRGQPRFHDESKEIAREVVINDAPPPIRFNLTKRSVQDDIQRRTNTIVVIKGRYQAPGTPANEAEGPLRLRVMPGNVGPDEMVKQQAVIAGASEVRRILQGGTASRPSPLPATTNIPPPDRMPGFVSGASQTMQAPVQMQYGMPTQAGHFVPQGGPAQPVQEMAQTVPLYVGVEAPPDFDLHGRLRGPGDSYLQHISSTTGATVTLRGRGSGMYDSPDHLHLFVSATNSKSFEDAKGLCVNLIDTVRADHAKMLSSRPPVASQPSAQQPQAPAPAHMANGHTNPAGPPPGGYQQASSSYPMHDTRSQPPPYAPPTPHQTASASAPTPQSAPNYPQSGQYQSASAAHNQPPYAPTSSAPFASHPGVGGGQGPPPGQGHAPPAAGVGAAQGHNNQQRAESPHGQVSPAHGQQGSFQGQPSFQQGRPGAQAGQLNPGQPSQGGHSMPGQHAPLQPAGYPTQHAQHAQQGPYARPQAFAGSAQGGQHHSSAYGAQPPQLQQQQERGLMHHARPAGAHASADYGPNRPQVGQQWPGQGAAARPPPAMSTQEMAQQAERKRRFTEQKGRTQWQQGATQQPSMPPYGAHPPRPTAPPQPGPPLQQRPQPALEPEAPPLPMGPPPPRSPVQFKMGSMGPPPPRLIRPPQGAPVQSRVPAQGLVPYGDDD